MPKKQDKQLNKGSIVIYRAKGGQTDIKVKLEQETVWLDAHQMAKIFGVQRPAIIKHIQNIYKARELQEDLTCSILEQVAADGRTRKMNLYNLDMIISVGYRINSKESTKFRIWATNVLRNYLVQGYAINQKRLLEQVVKFKELQNTIKFIKDKAKYPELKDEAEELFGILDNYANSLTLLHEYDKGKLKKIKKKKSKFILNYEDINKAIKEVKEQLIKKKEASPLFGREVENKFQGIINSIYQTFSQKELYYSVEEKAANLLYLIIKNHPFTDGNKRIGALLFVYFLEMNNYLWRKDNTRKINDSALVALALLVATSDPKEKEVMIKIITNLIND